ncbi:MAG: monofunctional biosynthetic peptidoglycan transglycosylase [Dehalococcoidia bacterium]|nr:monofunctional biosynthetic peptidoglycan transglycosylase [Dehalococcoidia bacterium]
MTEEYLRLDSQFTATADSVPRWVLNVTGRARKRDADLARLVRRSYQLGAKAAGIGLLLALARTWLSFPDNGRRWERRILSSGFIALAPIAVLRWSHPPTTLNMGVWRILSFLDKKRPPARYEWVDLDRIAPEMILAALSCEDAYFFWHCGFNPVEIWRAFIYNQTQRKPGEKRRGGSTISQQVAKNLFLTHDQSYLRKLVEAVFTAVIEGLWPKRRIIEVYLNIVHYGEGAFGVEAAARHFFGQSAAKLTAEQAVSLAAAMRGPEVHGIGDSSPKTQEVRLYIRQRMAWCGDNLLAELRETGTN